MIEETAEFRIGETLYTVPLSLARALRRQEGKDKSWRPELEAALAWIEGDQRSEPESMSTATPPQWEQVEVFGHQKHVGIVTEIEELGAKFLCINVPEYVYQRRRYSARPVKIGPAAIFRRMPCTEAEAQTRLSYQTNLFDGEPLPGLLVEEARVRLGGYSLTSDRAADLLGMPREEYAAIERCEPMMTVEGAHQLIADLAAAWVAAKVANRTDPPPGYSISWNSTYGIFIWHFQDEVGNGSTNREDAIADAWEHHDAMNDDEVPSNATAEAPAAEGIERLDFSKPPPGYTVAWLTHSSPEWVFRVDERDDFNQYDSEDKARSAAWAHYKARHDPPGMWTLYWENEDRVAQGYAWGYRSEAAFGTEPTQDAARAAAWAWYERRLALADLLESEDIDRRLTEHHPEIRTARLCRGWWPVVLIWSDEQVAAVERWLIDSTAEMPEVLRV